MADDIKIIIGVDATPVERAVRVMDNLEAEVRKVERAEKAGLITKERARAETDRLTASMQRLKVVANGSVSDFNKFEKGLYGSGKAARRNEIAFQQAGYQIQDFIVQVQAGTNPLIAFSQQGSQLAGFFAGPWGAAIGLGIAALSSFAMVLLSSKADAKSLQKQLEELEKATSNYEKSVNDLLKSQEELNKEYGAYASIAKGALETLKQLATVELDKKVKNFSKSIADTSGNVSIVNQKFREFLGLNERFSGNTARKMAQPMIEAMAALNAAEGPEEQLSALEKIQSVFKEVTSGQKELTEEQTVFLQTVATQIKEYSKLLGKTNQVVDYNAHITDYMKEQLDFIERRQKVEQEVVKSQIKVGEEQVKLLQAQGKYAEATELAVKLAREEARAKVLSSAENETQRRALEAQAIQAANLAEQAVRLTEQTRQTKEETKLATKEAKNYADAINKGLEKRDQFEQKALTALVGKLKAQGNLLAAEKLEVELAREAAVQKVLSTAKTIEGKNALVASAIAAADAAEQAVRLGYETDSIKNDARELEKALNASASAMDRMSSSSLNLHVQIAQAKAEAAALAAGLDVSVARSTAKARETYQAQYLEASGAAQMAGDLDAMEQAQRIYNEQLEGLKVLDTLMQSNAATKESQKGSSRTTDPIKSGTEYIERVLKKEIDLRKKSALMSDEQRKRAEFEFELRQRVDKYKEKASEKEIQAAMTLYDQAVRLERVGDIIDYSQGQFENFFMTVVDGTTSIEDAFKGMLRNILLEIYKQQVAKPAAEGIGNLLRKGAMAIFGGGQTTASAYGNVFQNGSVKAFANGTVVSSPTFFPMSNGTGLMAEAGPEAIMPLKRGPNGKLGVEASAGQQVVVNQSFNFAANGDESVKKIIAQAAPQIAQMTQKQIMDSRRRGGQMKAAFS